MYIVWYYAICVSICKKNNNIVYIVAMHCNCTYSNVNERENKIESYLYLYKFYNSLLAHVHFSFSYNRVFNRNLRK